MKFVTYLQTNLVDIPKPVWGNFTIDAIKLVNEYLEKGDEPEKEDPPRPVATTTPTTVATVADLPAAQYVSTLKSSLPVSRCYMPPSSYSSLWASPSFPLTTSLSSPLSGLVAASPSPLTPQTYPNLNTPLLCGVSSPAPPCSLQAAKSASGSQSESPVDVMEDFSYTHLD